MGGLLDNGSRVSLHSQVRDEGIFEGPVSKRVVAGHGFLIVGQGVQDGVPYYKIRNSIGKKWGEGGYGKIPKDYVTHITYPINALLVD
ncbi:hypothetical protein RJ639_023369 [Escallonia herrerae]|uniref:Peptidase C1A papain C-terminal domain-containing protein n=1 Tax=Escallonia herrerae TaxID=1293975 RepID=A0AA88UZW0_9ASTE|nr:hypothetical protein RJ639_023369 [Escallonia herrerae]